MINLLELQCIISIIGFSKRLWECLNEERMM